MFRLRDYQATLALKGTEIVRKYGIVVLSMEVRTGKTHVSFEIASQVKAKKVLFVTKKKPIDSGTLLADYKMAGHKFELILINYESLHKIKDKDFDLIIVDEFHSVSAFPKPSGRTKKLKEIFDRCKPSWHIMLSGTPTPESYSQIYHPFWINQRFTPFPQVSFYKWARDGYVEVKVREFAHGKVNDWSHADYKLIRQATEKYNLSYTQKEAGFTTSVMETIHLVKMNPDIYKLARKLKRDRVLENPDGEVVLAESPAQLMSKTHQIHSGSVILEEGRVKILDTSKAEYINQKFKGQKLAIFYKYKGEKKIIMDTIPNVTDQIDEFNNSDKHIALQIVSGREGISLAKADCLVMFNIDFSNVSYIQAKDRLTTSTRSENNVHWIFSEFGIERSIYQVVTKDKAKFNSVHFRKIA